jgi:hypothetical protein
MILFFRRQDWAGRLEKRSRVWARRLTGESAEKGRKGQLSKHTVKGNRLGLYRLTWTAAERATRPQSLLKLRGTADSTVPPMKSPPRSLNLILPGSSTVSFG